MTITVTCVYAEMLVFDRLMVNFVISILLTRSVKHGPCSGSENTQKIRIMIFWTRMLHSRSERDTQLPQSLLALYWTQDLPDSINSDSRVWKFKDRERIVQCFGLRRCLQCDVAMLLCLILCVNIQYNRMISECIVPVVVPKVKAGEQVEVLRVELGKPRVNASL